MARNTWPQFSDRYWYIDWGFGTIGVESDYYDGSSIDDDRLNIGNCYRTKLEAERDDTSKRSCFDHAQAALYEILCERLAY